MILRLFFKFLADESGGLGIAGRRRRGHFFGGSSAAHAPRYLTEDGTGHYLTEDGSGYYILE